MNSSYPNTFNITFLTLVAVLPKHEGSINRIPIYTLYTTYFFPNFLGYPKVPLTYIALLQITSENSKRNYPPRHTYF